MSPVLEVMHANEMLFARGKKCGGEQRDAEHKKGVRYEKH